MNTATSANKEKSKKHQAAYQMTAHTLVAAMPPPAATMTTSIVQNIGTINITIGGSKTNKQTECT